MAQELGDMGMTKPKYKICETENKQYRVYQGVTITTDVAAPAPYWDEEGNYIVSPDPNTSSTEYSCSNGHKWRA